MKTKDYVRLFKLDKPFYEFSREKFLNELGREFNQRVEDTRLERQRRNLEFTFSIFNKIVKEMEIKFWSISNKKHGLSFSEKLFLSSAFKYSTFDATPRSALTYLEFCLFFLIPIRKKYFPKEDQELTLKWERKKLEMQKLEEPKKSNGNKKPKNNKSLSHKTSN